MRNTLIYLFILSLTACEGFFGRETDIGFLDEPVFDDRTAAYVPIQPVWDGYIRPTDIIAGWDELIYIVDEGTQEIISLDQSGNELGRFTVPGLRAIAQDRRLDILALGTADTILSGETFVLPALYRIDLNKTGNYGLGQASIKHKIVHPFYFKSGSPTRNDEEVTFSGIAVLANNRYYVVRNGNSNNPQQFGGPDDAVLRFSAEDEFESPLVISTQSGPFLDYFKKPYSIATTAAPPQTSAVSERGDFVFTSIDPTSLLKVQYISFFESDLGSSFSLQQFTVGDTSRAEGFLYQPDRFSQPLDVTIAGDGTGYIFVVDALRDSLFQFNGLGLEGVNPPAGSSSNKVIKASFGGRGEGLTQFNEPTGVSYLDRIVYVADAGNGRILRFKLTLDFD